jgi:hypothetical protein
MLDWTFREHIETTEQRPCGRIRHGIREELQSQEGWNGVSEEEDSEE